MNKKLKIILFIILIIGTVSFTYATEYKTIQLKDIKIDIPIEYQNGEILNSSTHSTYRNFSDKNVFTVEVFEKYDNSFITNVGFWIKQSDSQERITINDRPALFLKDDNMYQGPITKLIFETDGKIVMINFPQSKELTDTGKHMVESTSPGIINAEQFYNILNSSEKDYKQYTKEQDQLNYAYEEGYYEGYDVGYTTGSPHGVISRIFNRVGL